MTVGIKSQVTAQIVDKLRFGGKEKTVVVASLVTVLEMK